MFTPHVHTHNWYSFVSFQGLLREFLLAAADGGHTSCSHPMFIFITDTVLCRFKDYSVNFYLQQQRAVTPTFTSHVHIHNWYSFVSFQGLLRELLFAAAKGGHTSCSHTMFIFIADTVLCRFKDYSVNVYWRQQRAVTPHVHTPCSYSSMIQLCVVSRITQWTSICSSRGRSHPCSHLMFIFITDTVLCRFKDYSVNFYLQQQRAVTPHVHTPCSFS